MNLFKSFDIGLRKKCARTPAPWAVTIHQIHAAGGVGGSTTMVVVFVVELCCVLWSRPSLILCKQVPPDNPKVLGLWV
jgi:hypothetical protein